jgi:methylated-DNA-[protein]-cysteine S-methyltransferase
VSVQVSLHVSKKSWQCALNRTQVFLQHKNGGYGSRFLLSRFRYHPRMNPYQAIFSTPFAQLGIRCNDQALLGLEFLPQDVAAQEATNKVAERVCVQLERYLLDPCTPFAVALDLNGTEHQQKVWRALLAIPRGATRSYGELAHELHSAAQAVGQACGANSIALIVPCHRVVSKTGLGGLCATPTASHWISSAGC